MTKNELAALIAAKKALKQVPALAKTTNEPPYLIRNLSFLSNSQFEIARMENEGNMQAVTALEETALDSTLTNNASSQLDQTFNQEEHKTAIQAMKSQEHSSALDRLKQLLKKSPEVQAVETKTALQLKLDSIVLNKEQELAVKLANDPAVKEMCLIGAAGTGKTTVVKAISAKLLTGLLAGQKLNITHKHLPTGIAPIVFCSFTNRAVRNLKRVLPKELQPNCVTIHALLEYYFKRVEKIDLVTGLIKMSQISVPKRGRDYPLTGLKYLVMDESSMSSVPLSEELFAALPKDCKILYLGDLNQLPPIYSSAILGYKLAESVQNPIKIPTVELTQVYRQALDNPILYDAHRILAGDSKYFSKLAITTGKLDRPGITYRPFKKKIEAETACLIIGKLFTELMANPNGYDPENDCILIPFNKQFGTLELNKYIAQKCQERAGVPVYEIISLYVKHYFAVGDRILIGKYEGKIQEILPNPKYVGRHPRSPDVLMNRWGMRRTAKIEDEKAFQLEDNTNYEEGELANMSMEDIDSMLGRIGNEDDAKRQSSHILSISIAETGEIVNLSEAGEINSILFAYALTVHKAQGAEWRKVYFILHSSHGTMASRELIYTAFTRAREELIILCDTETLSDGVTRQKIKGNSLAEKAEFFKGKAEEKQRRGSNLNIDYEFDSEK